jgi:hypothetical protein
LEEAHVIVFRWKEETGRRRRHLQPRRDHRGWQHRKTLGPRR